MDDDATKDNDITEEENSNIVETFVNTKYPTMHKVSQQSLPSSNAPTLMQATIFKTPTDEVEDDDKSDGIENEEEDEVNLLPICDYFTKKTK